MANRSVRIDVLDFLERQRPRRNQRWLAKKAGIAEATLSNILNAKHNPSLDLAVELSRITGIPVARFARSA